MSRLRFYTGSSNYIEVAPPVSASTFQLTLPSNTGTNGQLLSTNGSGVLSFVNGGKILQIVRTTDSTQRSTNSTTYVDVTGMTITITPQKSNSAIIVIASVFVDIANGTANRGSIAITDNSNNVLSGAERAQISTVNNISGFITILGYSTPATTSATTYKLRAQTITADGQTVYIQNALNTGQMYAIEVAA